jgi:hypothetical protein
MNPIRIVLLAVLACTACERTAVSTPAPEPAVSAGASVDARTSALAARDWPLPTPEGAAQPDLVRAPDGSLLLSWIERGDAGHALKFARWHDGAWSAPRTIASGSDWFVNWADTPHIAQTADGAIWAHWLRKTAAAPYAYDVVLVRSGDGGATWSAPLRVNDDGTPTEHGFASLWPASRDTLGVAWLDGRRTAGTGAHDAHAGHGAAGAMMTLRSARFDASLQRSGERELDLSTCDCCQTDVAMSARGPLLAYRDRTAAEIRDIHVATLDGDFVPRRVHADDWKMPACPVNGPSIDARDDEAVVGWYTAADDVPTLRLARSTDAGARFSPPVTVDRGEAMLGRVDVALVGNAVWLVWMREEGGAQSLQLARYDSMLDGAPRRLEVARLQGRGRGTGFPQLVADAEGVRVVWTDIVDGAPRLLAAQVDSDAAETAAGQR